MNMLNNSVIMCGLSPRETQKKKVILGNKKKTKTVKKTYYESPLKHIQQSSKKWAQMRVTRSMKRMAKKSKDFLCPKTDSSLNESVIVLSDNDCDSNEQPNSSNCESSVQSRKKSSLTNGCNNTITVVEPLRTLSSKRQKRSPKPISSSSNSPNIRKKTNTREIKKRKRKSVSNLEDSVCCLLLSDTEDSDVQETTNNIDGENIAPLSKSTNQGSDDIVVVWSSTKNSQSNDKTESQGETQLEEGLNEETNQRLFMIDYTPNKKNLDCLECIEPLQKKRKLNTGVRKTRWDSVLPFSKPGLQLPNPNEEGDKNTVHNSNVTNVANVANVANDTTVNPETSDVPDAISPSNACQMNQRPGTLREIVIDGNNVAMAHTKGKVFSEYGLKLAIDYFQRRGHTVKAFVPQYRRALCHPLLEKWYTEGTVVFTPSRNIGGRRITPYDDRFILEYATVCGGIVVSMDQYRDLYMEKPEWRDTIENRLLIPTFVGDYIMFPDDPLGRNGPRLDDFLRY